ncbi:transmembrane protein 107-like [Branchiostoma lanceolatum]|uniref:transmembrane protein 107-like n=1 Tax=Branchiostoma lanceolatum TaxID=7740 RepID=UPI001132DF1F
MATVNGIVPARFLTLIAHLIITINLYWTRRDNIEACLPETYTQDQYNQKDTELLVGLSLTLAFAAVELTGFFTGISMFLPTVGMLSTAAHASAAVSLSYFVFEQWECDLYWWVFGFCSAFPLVVEIGAMIAILGFKKT